jgi:ribulose-5-phosphate 4-epimerase/fuculose-1-phosphate aldolase/putative sterol carrier protein
MHEKALKQEICTVARTAYLRGLTAGWGGNLSVRLENGNILITPHRKSLAFLTPDDILTVDGNGTLLEGDRQPSSELKMQCGLYRALDVRAVVHLHPPALNSLTVRDVPLELLTFETRLTLGGTPPIIEQNTPIVTDVDALISAFQVSNIVLLKNHGTVAVGYDLEEAFTLTDVAEEAARMTLDDLLIQNMKTRIQGASVTERASSPALSVFSNEHMARILELVNADAKAQELGQATDLTVRYAIQQAEDGKVFNMHFDRGRIVRITADEDADFVNLGKREAWIHVFNGRLDPFAAVSQNKLRLTKGRIVDLSKWYAPFYRIFSLWRDAPVLELYQEQDL